MMDDGMGFNLEKGKGRKDVDMYLRRSRRIESCLRIGRRRRSCR